MIQVIHRLPSELLGVLGVGAFEGVTASSGVSGSGEMDIGIYLGVSLEEGALQGLSPDVFYRADTLLFGLEVLDVTPRQLVLSHRPITFFGRIICLLAGAEDSILNFEGVGLEPEPTGRKVFAELPLLPVPMLADFFSIPRRSAIASS